MLGQALINLQEVGTAGRENSKGTGTDGDLGTVWCCAVIRTEWNVAL